MCARLVLLGSDDAAGLGGVWGRLLQDDMPPGTVRADR